MAKEVPGNLPSYSTDLAAAMTLLDAWEGLIDTSRRPPDKRWMVTLQAYGRDAHYASADTLPLAIAKSRLIAALEAK